MRAIPSGFRRRALGAVALCLVTALGVIAFERYHLSELRRFHAVRLGMTEDEVLVALGKPPGQYGPPGATYGRSMWFG